MEEYMGAVERIHKEQAKEYEKVLKVRERAPFVPYYHLCIRTR